MKTITIALAALISTALFGVEVKPRTNLGSTGNSQVVTRFATYQKNHAQNGCKASGSGRRLLLTGFGLFSGAPYNISGATVASMASENFWPSEVETENLAKPKLLKAESGILTDKDFGVKIKNRSLRINGQNFEVCFLVLDVQWDFAAAIIIDQSTKFQPEFILMSGRGGDAVSLESGALNSAAYASGYESSGNTLESNTPVGNGIKVLDNYDVNADLELNWKTSVVAAAIESGVQSLGYTVELPAGARSSNDYICNNVSFVMAHAIRNEVTSLAGGKLILPSPQFSKKPVVGFFHFPAVDERYRLNEYGAQIYEWAGLLAKTILSI